MTAAKDPSQFVAVGVDRNPFFEGIQIRASRVDGAATITDDHSRNADRRQEFGDSHARGSGAIDHNKEVLESLVDDFDGVGQRGQDDDGGSVLVVVKHGNVELLDEPLFDCDASRGRNIFEIDAAKRRGEAPDDFDNRVYVVCVKADRKRVDAAKLLEQNRLPFHDRHGGPGAEIAESEHCRTVGDDCHGVAADRQSERRLGVVGRSPCRCGLRPECTPSTSRLAS